MAKTIIFEFEIRSDLTRTVKAEVSGAAQAFGWMLDDSGNAVASYELQFPYGKWTSERTFLERCEDVARVILSDYESKRPRGKKRIRLSCDEETDKAPYRIKSRTEVA